ncbi:hypothetical protein BC941DRAFT_514924 [Chlamydoabsidia padenii]|nr:hypothetical protein BC941DRAFT_514924 [Chlamydoabsidia padenii]
MESTSHNNTWNEDLQLYHSPGFNNHDILERICLYLPTQQDCFQAGFIDQSWRYAATKVLWESPVFKTPSSFRKFLAIIDRDSRFALHVKHLTLCLPDEITTWPLHAVRHHSSNNNMSRIDIIHHLVKSCQQLQSLTLYGWHLTQAHYDRLYIYLPHLKNLNVIGCNQQLEQTGFQLTPYLPHLTRLSLDGPFPISIQFAQAIATKARHLTTLQLSLVSMNETILNALCDDKASLDLTDLTLTDAAPIYDSHINMVLQRFTRLRKFRVEGSQYLTTAVIKSALKHCGRHLQYLDIRQATLMNKQQQGSDWDLDQQHHYNLRTLWMDRLWMDNVILNNVAFYCPYLTCLALTHTGLDLTDSGIECLGNAALIHLKHLYLIHCPMVTSKALIYLPVRLLNTLHLEHLGAIDSVDLYHVCSQAMEYAVAVGNTRSNLRRICVVGHEHVATWAMNALGVSSDSNSYQIILDQQAIDYLSTMDEFTRLTECRTLTSRQIVELARKLKMPSKVLIQLLDSLKVEPPVDRVQPSSTLLVSTMTDPDTTLSQQQDTSTPSLSTPLLPQKQFTLTSPILQQRHTPTPSSLQQPTNIDMMTTGTPLPNGDTNRGTTTSKNYDNTGMITPGDLGRWRSDGNLPNWVKKRQQATRATASTSQENKDTDLNQWGSPKKIVSQWQTSEPDFASEYLEEQKKNEPLWNTNDKMVSSYGHTSSTSNNNEQQDKSLKFSTKLPSTVTATMHNDTFHSSTKTYPCISDDDDDEDYLNDDNGDGITIVTEQKYRRAPSYLHESRRKGKSNGSTYFGKPAWNHGNDIGSTSTHNTKPASPFLNSSEYKSTKYKPRFASRNTSRQESTYNHRSLTLENKNNIIRWNNFAGGKDANITDPPQPTSTEKETADDNILVDISDTVVLPTSGLKSDDTNNNTNSNSTINEIKGQFNHKVTTKSEYEYLMDSYKATTESDFIHSLNKDSKSFIHESPHIDTENTENIDNKSTAASLMNPCSNSSPFSGTPDLSSTPTTDGTYSSPLPSSSTSSTEINGNAHSLECVKADTNGATGAGSNVLTEPITGSASTSQEQPLQLKFMVPVRDGHFLLILSKEDDHEAVHAFCVEHDMLDQEQAVFEQASAKYCKRRIDALFKSEKKTKKGKGLKKKATTTVP